MRFIIDADTEGVDFKRTCFTIDEAPLLKELEYDMKSETFTVKCAFDSI